jgi:hypothetical protein
MIFSKRSCSDSGLKRESFTALCHYDSIRPRRFLEELIDKAQPGDAITASKISWTENNYIVQK